MMITITAVVEIEKNAYEVDRTISVKIDYSEYIANGGTVNENTTILTATKSNEINDNETEVQFDGSYIYSNYIGLENNIATYEIDIPSDAEHIMISTYNIFGYEFKRNDTEIIYDNVYNYIYQGIKLQDDVDEYNLCVKNG